MLTKLHTAAIVTACFIPVCSPISAGDRPDAAGPVRLKIVQISDPQVGMTDFQQDVRSFEQAVKQANLLKPDLVILCGDMVHRPDNRSMAEASRIRAQFTAPNYGVPGNHEIDNIPSQSLLENYRAFFGNDYFSVRQSGYRFVFLNTSLCRDSLPAETGKQFEWLRNELEEARNGADIIYTVGHYPPFVSNPDEPDGYQNIPKAYRRRLLELFREYRVRGMLAGHLHRLYTNSYKETFFFGGESTSTNLDGRPRGFRLWELDEHGRAKSRFIPLYTRSAVHAAAPQPGIKRDAAAETCASRLRMIDACKEIIGMESGATNGGIILESAVFAGTGGEGPVCPAGGKYTVNALGIDPECSIKDHCLPPLHDPAEFKIRTELHPDNN